MPSSQVLKLLQMCGHSHPNSGSKRTHCRQKNGHILLKNVLLKLNSKDEDYLYDNCLVHARFFCLKYFLFQFFGGGIPMHIPILTRVH